MSERTYGEIPATGAFVLTAALMAWIKEEADRRGISASSLVREIVAGAKEQAEAKERVA